MKISLNEIFYELISVVLKLYELQQTNKISEFLQTNMNNIILLCTNNCNFVYKMHIGCYSKSQIDYIKCFTLF